MKNYTFEDLKFYPHENAFCFDSHAVLEFPNGYGLSVVNGECAHCDKNTYEVAILWRGEIDYSTDLTDDVLSYQTPEDITKVMENYKQ